MNPLVLFKDLLNELQSSNKSKTTVRIKLPKNAVYVPSTHLGHGHLFIAGTEIPTPDYVKGLICLYSAGMLENGAAKFSFIRGFSAVRKPGVYKSDTVGNEKS